jgi:predicted DNA-binding protein (UPF0251 family)
MTPTKFRELLDTAGLSQSEAAWQIGVSDRTIRRYLAARAAVPTLVVRAVMHVIEERARDATSKSKTQSISGTQRQRG